MANCGKCNHKIEDRRFMACLVCGRSYHLACANVSSPRYYLMSPSKKQSWKCNNCWEQSKYANDEKTVVETPCFVTKRKYRMNIPTCNSFDSLSEDESSDLSAITAKLNRSCPEIQTNAGEQSEELREKNYKLQLELESADEEIKNLLSENYALKTRISKLEALNKALTQICSSTKKVSTNIQRNSLKKRVLEFSNMDNSLTDQCNELEKEKRNLSLLKPTNFANKVDKDQQTVTNYENILENYNKQQETKIYYKTDNLKSHNNQQTKRKLCIISSNSRNKILQYTRNIIDHSDICHYITPGASISQILNGIKNKLKYFNSNDYCVIFIGDSDFKETNDYSKLIINIRNTMQEVQHTNIILCLPTYKSGNYANLYNKRVETFNNLLYRDNKYYEYAYLLDSNKKLEYYTKMYTMKGFVSNFGYKIIIDNLNELIREISNYYYYFYNLENPLSNDPNTTVPQSTHLSCSCLNKTFFR